MVNTINVVEKVKGRTENMLDEFNLENDIVNKVSKELSSKHENVYSSIISLKNEFKSLDKKNNELKNMLFNIEASNLKNKNTQVLFKENFDMDKVNKIFTELKDKVDKIECVFSKENDFYNNMIMSNFEDVKNISKELNKFCNGSDIEK